MKKVNLLLAALVCGCAAFADEIYDDMASTPELFKQWQSRDQFTKLLPNGGPEGKYAIEITSNDVKTSRVIRFNVPVDKVKGKKIELSAKVKAENVKRLNSASYLGVKFMFCVKTASGKTYYPEGRSVQRHRDGTYDWTELKTEFTVPADTTSLRIEIGFQRASGKILISDIDLDLED